MRVKREWFSVNWSSEKKSRHPPMIVVFLKPSFQSVQELFALPRGSDINWNRSRVAASKQLIPMIQMSSESSRSKIDLTDIVNDFRYWPPITQPILKR